MNIKVLLRCIGVVMAAAVLANCGGGNSDDTQTQIRLLNASPDLASANLYTGSDQQAAGIGPNGISGYATLDPDNYTIKVTNNIGVSVATASQDMSKKTRYTAVAWGRSGATKLTLLTEADDDTDGMSSGWGRLRVFNAAANDTGALDVYLVPQTTAAVDLTTVTPVMTATTSTVTAYSDLLAGNYRLIVTANQAPADVRLDVQNINLGDQQMLSLILEPGASGVLVHGLVLAHQAGLAVQLNPDARVRVVASVAAAASGASGGQVQSTIGSAGMVTQTSPQIGGYTLVPAANPDIAITSAGNALSVGALTAGGDYTVLVTGAAGAVPTATTIFDDNRLPTNSTTVKVRLLDGFATNANAATLTINSSAASVVAPPGVSAYSQVAAGTAVAATIVAADGTQLWTSTPTNSTSTITLTANGVYTFFVLDGQSSGTPAIPTAAGAGVRAER